MVGLNAILIVQRMVVRVLLLVVAYSETGVHLRSFAEFLGNSNAFAAELHGVMCPIEVVFDRG
jgi:hypothetical protein